MALRGFPLHATELLKQLQTEFPPRCIKPEESLEDAHRYAGKVELVAYLQTWLNAAERKG